MKKLKNYVKETWGGKCLATKSSGKLDQDDVLMFRCKKDHEFERSPKEIYNGYFCNFCTYKNTMKVVTETSKEGANIANNLIDVIGHGIKTVCEIKNLFEIEKYGKSNENKKLRDNTCDLLEQLAQSRDNDNK